MLITESEIGPLVLGLTPPYLDPNCHEALHEVDLGALKSEFRSTEEHEDRRLRAGEESCIGMGDSSIATRFFMRHEPANAAT